MKNLFIRNNNYQFRVNIPSYMQYYFNGKKLYIKSMRTNKKSAAVKFRKILLTKFEHIKDCIKLGMEENEIFKLVDEFTNTLIEETEVDLYNTPNIEDTTFYLMLDDTISSYQMMLQNNDYTNSFVVNFINNIKDVSMSQSDIDKLSHVFIETTIDNLKQIRLNIQNKKYDKAKLRKPINITKYKLDATFNEYIDDVSISDNWSQDTMNLNNNVKYLLELYFSTECDITKISNKDLLTLRKMMFNIPTKLKQRKQFVNKSLDYIVTNSTEIEKISISTINKYITRINQFFNYVHNRNYTSEKLYLDKVKDSSFEIKRTAYSEQDLLLVQQHSLELAIEERIIINIAMYSGMRLNEILQLKKCDIKCDGNIYYFDVNNNDNKTIKNKSSIRLVPIHDKIKGLVLQYVNDKTDDLFTYDSKEFSKFYRLKFNRKYITQDSKKVFHSFRHTFANALIQADVKGEHVASLLGHSQDLSMTFSTYGQQINIKLLKSAIDKINY